MDPSCNLCGLRVEPGDMFAQVMKYLPYMELPEESTVEYEYHWDCFQAVARSSIIVKDAGGAVRKKDRLREDVGFLSDVVSSMQDRVDYLEKVHNTLNGSVITLQELEKQRQAGQWVWHKSATTEDFDGKTVISGTEGNRGSGGTSADRERVSGGGGEGETAVGHQPPGDTAAGPSPAGGGDDGHADDGHAGEVDWKGTPLVHGVHR